MLSPERIEEIERQREKQFEEFVGEFDLDDLAVQRHLHVGAPHAAVVEIVREHDADLVVMGTHGRRGFQKFFLGSTASKVLRRMPCAVMTVRTREEEGE